MKTKIECPVVKPATRDRYFPVLLSAERLAEALISVCTGTGVNLGSIFVTREDGAVLLQEAASRLISAEEDVYMKDF